MDEKKKTPETENIGEDTTAVPYPEKDADGKKGRNTSRGPKKTKA